MNVNDVGPIIQEPNNNAIPSETIAARYYYSQLDSYGKMIYDKLKQNKKQPFLPLSRKGCPDKSIVIINAFSVFVADEFVVKHTHSR